MLELRGVSKAFGPAGKRYEVLRDINLSIAANAFTAIIGFSGSGKSTLMKVLCGLERPDSGAVLLEGRPIVGPGPQLGIVFQNYSLLPWLTVAQNVELAVRKVFPAMSRSERAEHIQRYLALVKLGHAGWKKPHELSGGMRQRLSLARTLAMQPRVLLLDEPLSALDCLTRAVLQDEIIRLWEVERRTVVMITNDVDEAALMADRIVPLTKGPGATLGPAFEVDLPRPRDRTTLNYDSRFRTLRAQVSAYLRGLNAGAATRQADRFPLPDLDPVLPGVRIA
jgi:nitrate/nitrite transport system ATP-binding protein